MEAATSLTRVLLVDDDEDDYLIIRNLIAKIPQSPFTLDWIANVEEAIPAIKAEKHDIYLIDYRLGAQTGLELLSQFDLVQRPEPFIVLTGAGDDNVERKAMRMGIADYLVKGTFGTELLSRVLRYSFQRKHMEAQRIEQLLELNKSKDEFIALASHQLRTPATAVKQYIGMVLQGYAGEVTEQQRNFLNSAYESNERQINVVNDILRVAKLDLKKMTLRIEQTDVSALMANIIRDAEEIFRTRKQQVTYKQPKEAIKVEADPEQLRMALGNLLENASKYTPEGKNIYARVEQASDGTVTIAVQDEGVGIASEDLDKLFKKFSRIHNPLSIEVGGTGLGLYWSNEIIHMHNGTIEVTSEPDKGTTFTVVLPQEKPQKKPSAK